MFTKGHNHGDHGGRPAASGDGALTGARRRPRTGPACRCSCPPGSGTAGGRRPWPCRSRSSLGEGERTGQGPLAATGVRKATTSGSRGGQEEEQDGHLWGERGRNVTFQVPLLSAWHLTLITKATRLTLLLLLRKLRLGHGGHRAQVHTHTCAEAKRRKAGRGPLTAACEQGRAAVTSAGFRVRPRGFNSQLFRLPPKKSWARSQNLSHPVTPSAKWG